MSLQLTKIWYEDMVSLNNPRLRCKCLARGMDRKEQNIEGDKEFMLHCAGP